VRLGNEPEDSFVVIDYDPDFPSGGVRLRLEEGGVRIEVAGDSTPKGYGELFQVGQIWLRVRKEE
jgi:hypothetical protein